MHQPTPPQPAGEVSLVVNLGGLRVTVSGPVPEATALLAHLQTFQPTSASAAYPAEDPVQASEPRPQVRSEASQASSAQPARLQLRASVLPQRVEPESPRLQSSPTGVPVSDREPSAQPSASSQSPAAQVPLQASATFAPTRSEVEAAFPACPADLLLQASALSGAANISASERIRRAWRAGLWAREVLQGNFPTPSASARLSLPSRVYVVLGGGTASPGVYRAFRDLTRALGPIAQSTAVFHGFPSDTEGVAYCRGAGLPWPPERQ